MIPSSFITEWREHAPWIDDHQVEQDLIISRALCELYSDGIIQDSLSFRGGTSLQKIFFKTPQRYSEDIDLVQITKAKIGSVITVIRKKLDGWLGKPTVDQKKGRVTLRYKYLSENAPKKSMKLKIEINSSEHFSVLGYKYVPFEVDSSWFKGKADITTFEIEEIMGTKLRALYQRKKGRDLFDFQKVYDDFPNISSKQIVECFLAYMNHEDNSVSRANFEKNLFEKMKDPDFSADISSLLISGDSFDLKNAYEDLIKNVISLIPGDPWKQKRG